MRDTRSAGRAGEDAAVEYLAKKGYHIIRRNYRFGRNEIDIVAEEEGELVFVEVKARKTTSFGDPEDAVTPGKFRRMQRVAQGYLFEQNIHDQSCRFDIIAIELGGNPPIIRHLRNAY